MATPDSPAPQTHGGELPGHVRKAFRSIERFLPVIDLVLELLDARMPLSSRIHGLTERLGKTSLLILGKADLAEPEKTRAWCEWFEKAGQPCISFRTDQPRSRKALIEKIQALFDEKVSHNRNLHRMMVIGIPNVGKSTLINSLAGRRAARVANLPGVTRSIQWIKITGKMELLDLPGVLDFSLLRRGNVLRLLNTLPGPNEDPEPIVFTLIELLRANGMTDILPGFAEAGNMSEFLTFFARKMHFLSKGSQPDIRRAAIDLLKRFQAGYFGPVSLEAPENL